MLVLYPSLYPEYETNCHHSFVGVQVRAPYGRKFVRDKVALRWLNQMEDTLTYTSSDVCDENSPTCILTRVLDFTCEKSGDVLTINVSPEEDIRCWRC